MSQEKRHLKKYKSNDDDNWYLKHDITATIVVFEYNNPKDNANCHPFSWIATIIKYYRADDQILRESSIEVTLFVEFF